MSMEPFQQQDFPLRPFSVQRALPPGSMPSVRVVPYVACRMAIDSISPAQSICALLLADEPMGNLDTRSADEVFALLRQFNTEHGTTVLFVTHNENLAARCDKTIAVIDRRLTR